MSKVDDILLILDSEWQYKIDTAKEQLLAEVLDMIGGWHKYPSKALPGDEAYVIAETINKRNTELRQAAKERFK